MNDLPEVDPGRPWADMDLRDLLAVHGLDGLPEQPFAHDGWSGSTLTMIDRGDRGFILKRTSAGLDWIVRATRDDDLREAGLASARVGSGAGVMSLGLVGPHLGAARDDPGQGAAILMNDVSAELIAWDRPGDGPEVDEAILDAVVSTMARVHAVGQRMPGLDRLPWCPLPERLGLLTRPAALRYQAAGNPVGSRFLAGWDAFDRSAPGPARDLIARLSADPTPLVGALSRLPATLLHGDLKLANVALMADGIGLIDWQMASRAPIAVELGWFLVSNVAQLPEAPDLVLARYRAASEAIALEDDGHGGAAPIGDWATQVDLAILVGLLLRGWRKGLDAEAGLVLPTGAAALDDLTWWSERAIKAAVRRL
jgi:Phosphotransferase enzyme family